MEGCTQIFKLMHFLNYFNTTILAENSLIRIINGLLSLNFGLHGIIIPELSIHLLLTSQSNLMDRPATDALLNTC